MEIFFRSLLYLITYKGFNLFCGDSAYYVYLANNLHLAAADRPSGFPFLLRLLLLISNSPLFLLAVNNLMGILTAVFLFLTLSKILRGNNLAAFSISLIFALLPVVYYIDSLIYMSDAFALFLIAALFYLIFSRSNNAAKTLIKNLLAALFLGYLIIIKSVFLYLSPFILLLILFRQLPLKTTRGIKIISGLLIVLTFSIVPTYYAFFFNKPRLGTTSIDNIGGRAAFGKIMPHMSCNEIVQIADSQIERNAILKKCNDAEINRSTPDKLIWDEKSSMNKIIRIIVPDQDRVKENATFRRWFTASIIRYPRLILLSMQTSLSQAIERPIARQLSFTATPKIDGGCESLVSDHLSISADVYLQEWKSGQEKHGALFMFLEKLSEMMQRIMNIITFVVLLFITFTRLKVILRDKSLLLMTAMSWAYLFAISLAGSYDTRYYIIFIYMSLITAGLYYSRRKIE